MVDVRTKGANAVPAERLLWKTWINSFQRKMFSEDRKNGFHTVILIHGGESPMAKGDDIQDRLIRFAVSVMTICEGMPRTITNANIANQLSRSASAAAPNYAEARGAESRNDFIHKLGITFKELNESEVWLKMLLQKGVMPEKDLRPVLLECSALCRIIAASRTTASRGSSSSR